MNKTAMFLLCLVFLGFSELESQSKKTLSTTSAILTTKNKGKMFFHWGWNRSQYTKSDIKFKGADYNFTLSDVIAHDRQSSWDPDKYLNPANITIPQTNMKIGYFISDHWNIAIANDHMKYVMDQDQTVRIDGIINQDTETAIYNGIFQADQIELDPNFLEFEHTDGLNFIHFEVGRFDNLGDYLAWDSEKLQLNFTEALGIGLLYPKTNSVLLNKKRYDDFNVAGYGISLKGGINLTLLNNFFIQAELKTGYIDMKNIRTTKSTSDSASQEFFFFQQNLTFGYVFQLVN